MQLATYIVRIYWSEKGNPRGILGVVEQIGVKGRKAFTDYDELWEILNSAKTIRLSNKERKLNFNKQKTNLRSK
jgi:hypothetical protein